MAPINPATISLTLLSGSAPPAALRVLSVQSPIGPIVALLPQQLAPGLATVSLDYNGQAPVTSPVTIVPSSFGIFSHVIASPGPAAAIQTTSSGATSSNALSTPALPGSYLSLFGSGLGSPAPSDVTVLLGGHAIEPSYAGPAPGEPGIDQINFEVPNDPAIPDSCYVAVSVLAAGITSNTVTIAKASEAGPCASPLAFTPAEMATLDQGGSVSTALLIAGGALQAKAGGVYSREETATLALYLLLNASSAAQFVRPALASDAIPFGCQSSSIGTIARALGFLTYTAVGGNPAGDTVTLEGSQNSVTLTPQPPFGGVYAYDHSTTAPTVTQLGQPAFAAGSLTLRIPGATAIGSLSPSSTLLAVAPEIAPSLSAAPLLVNRSQDLELRWPADGFGPSDTITLTLSGGTNTEWFTGYHSVTCTLPAASGAYSIPASLLAAFPSGAPNSYLQFDAHPISGVSSSARLPLASGASMPLIFQFSSSALWPVLFQ